MRCFLFISKFFDFISQIDDIYHFKLVVEMPIEC